MNCEVGVEQEGRIKYYNNMNCMKSRVLTDSIEPAWQ